MPLANRPLLFHTLDRLQESGIETVSLVLDPGVQGKVIAAIGDGRGWDMRVEAVQARQNESWEDLFGQLSGALGDAPFFVQDGGALLGDIGASLARFDVSDLDALALRLPSNGPRSVDVPSIGTVAGCFFRARPTYADHEPTLELSDLLAGARRFGARVEVGKVDGCLPCRGGREMLVEANRRVLERLRRRAADAVSDGTVIQGPVSIHPTARLHKSIVRGPAVIGPRSEIIDGYVGPYTSIGADVVCEGVEIENSVVLDFARLTYLGARVEGSVIGRGVRVGRAFGVPQALRLLVGNSAEVTLAQRG